MSKKNTSKAKPGIPTQKFLDIAEIKEDVVVMKDGTLRVVLLVSSINFALKSVDEQNAVVQSYMQFLNMLDYPIQISIQSRRMNIDDYLAQLREQEKKLTNELLRRQILDYTDYIKQLVDLGDIMQKRFYVVIPYDPATAKQKGFFARFSEILTPAVAIRLSEKRFRDNKDALMLRVNQVTSGIQSMGLSSAVLDTQSLIELYYTVYNPNVYESQRMNDIDRLQIEQ
ncbi:hypothetical protein KJ937_02765 [Patescibacteria group bacterium]|nr:hypothetical protein [Patescibacteria group bacterium]